MRYNGHMITLKIASKPELVEINSAVAKYNLEYRFGISPNEINFNADTCELHFKIEEKFTDKLIEIIGSKLITWNGLGNGLGNGLEKRPVGRPRGLNVKSGTTVNTTRFVVEDPEAYAICRIYLNRNLSQFWDEKAKIFTKSCDKGLEKYGMKLLGYEEQVTAGSEGWVQLKVTNLVGIPIYKAFGEIKNFAARAYTMELKIKQKIKEKDLPSLAMWGKPSKWSVVVHYPDGREVDAIRYDWAPEA